MMKNIITFSIILLFIAIESNAQEKQSYTIAVLDLDATGVSEVEAKVLSENLRYEISKAINSQEYKNSEVLDQYQIVERSKMEKIFREFEV